MNRQLQYPRQVFSRDDEFLSAPSEVREALLAVYETVFFASLMAEEGENVPIGIVVDVNGDLENVRDIEEVATEEGPPKAWSVWPIEPMEFNAHELKKLAHGVEYGRDVIVVDLKHSPPQMTGIARRRIGTSGGDVLRVAAPRPGVIVLEGGPYQVGGMRYDAGVGRPNDLEVLFDPGPVLQALERCRLSEHAWMLSDVLRHARATHAGAMFLCVPEVGAVNGRGSFTYRFKKPSQLGELARERRTLLFRNIAATQIDGAYDAEQAESLAEVLRDRASNRFDLEATLAMLGRLAANDGAVVIAPDFHVLGAGFVIGDMQEVAAAGMPQPLVCVDATGTRSSELPPRGGARHAAAYRFAWAVPGSVVFVVSSDGPVRCVLRRQDDLLTWSVRIQET